MTQANRPTRAEIATKELAEQIFVRGPADVGGLQQVCAIAREKGDKAAEAIARFGLGNYLDGNVPGADKLDHFAAINEFTRALELYPKWPEASFNRGIAHIHVGNYTEAIKDFDEAEPLFLEGISNGSSLAAGRDRLLLGKLYLFRAEAHTKRREGDDLQRARGDIDRAQTHLVLSTPSARHWLEQIPRRRLAIDDAVKEDQSDWNSDRPVRQLWPSFGFGFGAVAMALSILFVVIVVGTPKPDVIPNSDHTTSASQTHRDNTSKSIGNKHPEAAEAADE